jgi:hypothetical protein
MFATVENFVGWARFFELFLFISDENEKHRTSLKETAFAHRFYRNGGHHRQRLVQ